MHLLPGALGTLTVRTEPPYCKITQEIQGQIHVEEARLSSQLTDGTDLLGSHVRCRLESSSPKPPQLTLPGGEVGGVCRVLPNCRYMNQINDCRYPKAFGFKMIPNTEIYTWCNAHVSIQVPYFTMGNAEFQSGKARIQTWVCLVPKCAPLTTTQLCPMKMGYKPQLGKRAPKLYTLT